MTKTEAKKIIKDQMKVANEVSTVKEKIVDMEIYKDEYADYMFTIITVSDYHTPYKYSGWVDSFTGEIHFIKGSCGLLTVFR